MKNLTFKNATWSFRRLTEEIIKKYWFISKKDAVLKIHFPRNKQEDEQAEYRLAYGELFDINYKSIWAKFENFRQSEGKSDFYKNECRTCKRNIINIFLLNSLTIKK